MGRYAYVSRLRCLISAGPAPANEVSTAHLKSSLRSRAANLPGQHSSTNPVPGRTGGWVNPSSAALRR
jgi:hypothetical protein